MRGTIFRVLALVAVAALVLVFLIVRPIGHKLVLKSYLADARGLRAGAAVRLAGVDVGSVKSVRVQPQEKGAPVEVVMVLITPYDLKVPNDSIVLLATAGVLGETYMTIDTSRASGPPVGAEAVLKSKPIAELSTEQMIQKLGEFMQKSGDCDCKKNITDAKLLSRN